MREFMTSEDAVVFCKALASKLRLEMLQYIYNHKGITLSELAAAFEVSRAAITQNIQILMDADLLEIRTKAGRRGVQKCCYLKEDHFVIALDQSFNARNMYLAEIPIGQYTSYKAVAPCGIATPDRVIGVADDPRYFDDPARMSAGIIWLDGGYLTYRLPNYLQAGQSAIELQLSMELGGLGSEDSDVYFYFNGEPLGCYTSPAECGDVRGSYTPDWWQAEHNQYGLLKLLIVNNRGVFLDGHQISSTTINDLAISPTSEMNFKMSVGDSENTGGLTVYGRGFGNYNQDIRLRLVFEEGEQE